MEEQEHTIDEIYDLVVQILEKIKIYLNSTELAQDGTPSPSSPVDVNIITGDNNIKISNSDNTEEQNYAINLSSKNLFDFNKVVIGKLGSYGTVSVNNEIITFTGNNQTVYGVEIDLASLSLKDNTTYTISNLFTNTGTFANNHGWRYYNGSSYTNFGGYEKEFSFTTTTSKVNKLYYYVGSPTRYTGTLTLFQIQLEEGNVATTYEPYYNLEYCKIGDYADQIFKNTIDSEFYDSTLIENEWYLKKNIGKVTYNGSETGWAMLGMTNGKQFYINQTNIYHDNTQTLLKSNYFKSGKVGDRETIKDTVYSFSTGIAFNPESTVANTLDDWRTWLSSHNTNVYYPLATSQYIQLSQEDYPTLKAQLENLYNNAKSYNGQTNITQTNDDLPFSIDYELIENPKDLKGVISDINEFLRVNL